VRAASTLAPVFVDYSVPGPLTDLTGFDELVSSSLSDPVGICAQVAGLVIEPDDALAAGVAAERTEERQLRPARAIVSRLLEMRREPLSVQRPADQRVVGTCRHFAVLACALLRHQGVASRVRCGFATYFQPGCGVDHWIVEYRAQRRWVRTDPEVLGGTVIDHAQDLRADDFLSGAEAWRAHRAGRINPDRFGVYGTENWGVGEIRGNLVKDLAALNKLEMLPWDEWGEMEAGYDDTAGPAYDALLDRCAESVAEDDPGAIVQLATLPELHVPDTLVSATL